MLLACSVMTSAADNSAKFVLDSTRIVALKSRNTGRDHELVIVFPESYATNPKQTYPVLYFLDAYWDTPLLVSTYGNLRYDNRIPELLMVGLSYPAGKDFGVERRIDYTPTPVDAKSGKAEKFLAFVQQEVAPLIESQYRGEPKGRTLAGVSLGGLFTLYSAYTQTDFFSAYIAISPAVAWDQQVFAKLDDVYAKSHDALPATLFVSVGTEEYQPFRAPIEAFQERLTKRSYKNLDLLNYQMEGLRHTSVKGEGYVRGLTWAFRNRTPAGPSGLEKEMKAAGE